MAINFTPLSLSTLNNISILGQTNSNFSSIQALLPDALSRSGQTPNQMQSVLDMNNNQILNLPPPSTVNSPARLIDVVSNPSITVPGTGTSGHVVPFLDGSNTWSGVQTFSSSVVLSAGLLQIGTSSIGSVVLSAGTSTTQGTISLQNPNGVQFLTITGPSGAANLNTTISSLGGTAINFASQVDYGFGTTSPQHFANFTTLTIDNTNVSGGGVIALRTNGTLIGDIFCGSSIGMTYNTITGTSHIFDVNNSPVMSIVGTGVNIGFNGTLGALLVLNGLTSGSANISASATGGTLNINSNCTIDASGNLIANSVNTGFTFISQGPTNLTGTSGTVNNYSTIINASGTFTATLPSATGTGRWIIIKSIAAQIVNSNLTNIVGLTGGAATNAIFPATAGKWAILQADGTNWQIMAGN